MVQPGTSPESSEPAWHAYVGDLDGWSVFTATLYEEGGLQSKVELVEDTSRALSKAQSAFLDEVASILKKWLERSSGVEGDAAQEAFSVLVATAPGDRHRVGLMSRPRPKGCKSVPSVRLVQDVLHEILDAQAFDRPAVVAVYVVDLMEETGQRFSLGGSALDSSGMKAKILTAFLKALLRRSSNDFPNEVGHSIRMSYLSDGKVVTVFFQRRGSATQAIEKELSDLRSAAIEDLRFRLAQAERIDPSQP